MKKKLIITESQYKRLINEQEDDYTEQLLLLINSNIESNLEMVKEIAPGQGIDLVQFLSYNIDKIEPPYFYKFYILGLNNEERVYVLKNLYSFTIKIYGENNIYDTRGNQLYYENNNGDWTKREYDSDGNEIYFEKSDGYWSKYEYDLDRNVIYFENSDGNWYKKEYDSDGNEIYFEKSDGYWSKYEYDSNGYGIYKENSKGYWLKKEFDSNGNQIYYENSKGIWEKHEYDENGKPLYIENSENGIIMDRR
jgi:hypothetical protein